MQAVLMNAYNSAESDSSDIDTPFAQINQNDILKSCLLFKSTSQTSRTTTGISKKNKNAKKALLENILFQFYQQIDKVNAEYAKTKVCQRKTKQKLHDEILNLNIKYIALHAAATKYIQSKHTAVKSITINKYFFGVPRDLFVYNIINNQINRTFPLIPYRLEVGTDTKKNYRQQFTNFNTIYAPLQALHSKIGADFSRNIYQQFLDTSFVCVFKSKSNQHKPQLEPNKMGQNFINIKQKRKIKRKGFGSVKASRVFQNKKRRKFKGSSQLTSFELPPQQRPQKKKKETTFDIRDRRSFTTTIFTSLNATSMKEAKQKVSTAVDIGITNLLESNSKNDDQISVLKL